jgi:uroporphyrinogen decarboxylase
MMPADRFHAALDGERPDRIPLFYQHLGGAKWVLRHTGLKMYDGFHDPDIFARLAMAAYELFGFDNVMAGWGDLLIEAQAHGMKWRFPERDLYPGVEKYLPMSEIDKVQQVDPARDPFWSVPLHAAERMMDHYRDRVPVVGCINAPNMIVSELIGVENLMIAYLTDSDRIEHLLSVLAESSKAYGERILEVGMEDVFISNAMAGLELVSPQMYERYDRKYLKAAMDSYHRHGLRTILHNCAASPLWQSQMELKPTSLHLSLTAIDALDVFAALKGRTCFMAGIDHMKLLFERTPAEIERKVGETMALWGDDPGFIIAPGCELPYETPRENIEALRESVIRHRAH